MEKLRKRFQRISKEKGITLVALVVTIIILIILATVAINFAFGSNGLIRRAEDARDYYANDTAYTDESMANVESYLDELINERNTLVQALKDGRISVGDYVSYTPDAHDPVTVGREETGFTNLANRREGTDQTFSQNSNTTWRVLGLSEDGEHVLLTTGSPIKADGADPYLVLEASAGAANCVTVLNKISGLYHNSTLAEETRSITIEDIERAIEGETVTIPEEGELKIEEITVTYPQEGESDTGEVIMTGTFNSESITIPIGETTPYPSYTYKEGDYLPSQDVTVGQSIDADAYGFACLASERVLDMLFAGTTKADNYAKSYWLASPRVYADSDYVRFDPGAVYNGCATSGYRQINSYTIKSLFASDGKWDAVEYAVRPVVVLKSDVTIDQVQKIEDQEEEIWTTTGGQTHRPLM